MSIKTSNTIDSIGFPESHIIAHVEGNFELCGEIAAAYLDGTLENFLESRTLNRGLTSICNLLLKMEDYKSRTREAAL
jgi:hypothetical protein